MQAWITKYEGGGGGKQERREEHWDEAGNYSACLPLRCFLLQPYSLPFLPPPIPPLHLSSSRKMESLMSMLQKRT